MSIAKQSNVAAKQKKAKDVKTIQSTAMATVICIRIRDNFIFLTLVKCYKRGCYVMHNQPAYFF